MERRTIDIDGEASYADFGGDGSPMVLVHGLGGSHVDWTAVGPRLAERARVVAPDLIGFGYTPMDCRSASVESNQRFLDRFIAQVAGKPVILVGNSMGGLLSIMQAAAKPASVRSLVLVNPALPPVAGEAVDPFAEQIFTAYDTPGIGENLLRQMVDSMGLDAVFDLMMAFICADPSRISPELRAGEIAISRDRLEQPWADRAMLEAARSLLVEIYHEPQRFFDRLERVEAPALLIVGEHDRLVRTGAAEDIARRRPDWTHQVLDGIGHVPMMEDPDRFVDVVWRWLDAVVVGPPGQSRSNGIP